VRWLVTKIRVRIWIRNKSKDVKAYSFRLAADSFGLSTTDGIGLEKTTGVVARSRVVIRDFKCIVTGRRQIILGFFSNLRSIELN
jgi:hypothetical protein